MQKEFLHVTSLKYHSRPLPSHHSNKKVKVSYLTWIVYESPHLVWMERLISSRVHGACHMLYSCIKVSHNIFTMYVRWSVSQREGFDMHLVLKCICSCKNDNN